MTPVNLEGTHLKMFYKEFGFLKVSLSQSGCPATGARALKGLWSVSKTGAQELCLGTG